MSPAAHFAMCPDQGSKGGLFLCGLHQEGSEFVAFVRNDCQDSTKLNGDLDGACHGSRKAKRVANQNQVSGGGDRQKFGQPLYHTKQDRQFATPFLHGRAGFRGKHPLDVQKAGGMITDSDRRVK